MNKSIQLLGLLVGGLFFTSCQEEEFVTQRDYTFVESGQIVDINETGATAVFEILKPSPSAIQEYGVEFLESDLAQSGEPGISFLKISQTGSPDQSPIEQRINYDLLPGREYLVRPFVRAGNKTTYGEELIFDSRGVAPPVLTEVSPNELYQVGQIKVKGDFFQSRKELNTVELLGLENDFLIQIDSVNRNELWFTYIPIYTEQRELNGKYDLKVTSGGKSTILQDAVSVVLPRIVNVSPLSAFVGEKIQIQLNQPVDDPNGINFQIFNESISLEFTPESLGGGRFQFDFPLYPFGKYKLAVIRGYQIEVYEEEIELKSSWEVFAENIPWTDKRDWNRAYVGDQLLVWNPQGIEFNEFYSFSADDLTLRGLPSKPGNMLNREIPLLQPVADRYLYFGLGRYYDQETLRDFHRFDTQTNTWERLPDFPFELTAVVKSFVYQGKIYLEMLNGETNFITFDLTSLRWERTSFQLPDLFRQVVSVAASDQGIFYMSPRNEFSLYRYIPGQIEDVYMAREGSFGGSIYKVKNFEDKILVFDGSRSIFKADLNTKTFQEIQTIDGTSNISAFPWITSKGLLMTFPYLWDQNRVEDKAYRLIQDL